jgi:hypothetical protein
MAMDLLRGTGMDRAEVLKALEEGASSPKLGEQAIVSLKAYTNRPNGRLGFPRQNTQIPSDFALLL